MQLPNKFKIGWWIFLTLLLTAFLLLSYGSIASGHLSAVDDVAFIVWVGLLLAPLFSEISLFGVKLKQSIDELKSFVSTQVADIRSDVRNAVDIRTTFSPNFYVPAPPPDAQLPDLETRIKDALSSVLASHGVQQRAPMSTNVSVSDEVISLFSLRYSIESELRRLARNRDLLPQEGRRRSIFEPLRALIDEGTIEPQLYHAIRDVYAVCSPAIHGEPVTDKQVSFAKDVGPELVAILRRIS